MRAAFLSGILVLATLLAGCAGSTDPAPMTLTGGGLATAPSSARLEAPVWQPGDWWNFTTPNGALSYVVSGQAGADYIMDTDNPGLAFFNVLSDISTLGPIRKSDLAGSQGDTRVEFFRWPLVDGANWTTTWDNTTVAVTATQKGDGGFSFVALRADGTKFASYSYDNETRWFTALEFFDAAGTSAFGLTLASSGSAFAGDLVRWEIETLYEETNLTGVPSSSNGNFDIPAGTTDLYLTYDIRCSSGLFNVALGPLDPTVSDAGYQRNGSCGEEGDTAILPVAAAGGQWGHTYAVLAPDPNVTMTVLQRTLTSFPVGEAPA